MPWALGPWPAMVKRPSRIGGPGELKGCRCRSLAQSPWGVAAFHIFHGFSHGFKVFLDMFFYMKYIIANFIWIFGDLWMALHWRSCFFEIFVGHPGSQIQGMSSLFKWWAYWSWPAFGRSELPTQCFWFWTGGVPISWPARWERRKVIQVIHMYIYIHTYVCNVMQCNVIWTGTWHLQVSCMEAKREWRGVSGLFRKTSRTFEHCFAALASLIVMLALCALYDLRQGLRVRNRTEEVGLKQPKIQLIQLAFF